ncbi:MAG: phosphoenolpyruvate--protein phosphotransferase [Gemmatimonadota bacterium]
MPLEWSFTCPLTNGVHARPASALEEVARRFSARVSLTNARTRMTADATSVLGIIGLDIRRGDQCVVAVSGTDEARAAASLQRFLEDEFPRCDEPLIPVEAQAAAPLPPVLRQVIADYHTATPAVPGIGRGLVVAIGGFAIPESIPIDRLSGIDAEITALDTALDQLALDYEARVEPMDGPSGRDGIERDLIRAHLSVARDPEFRHRLEAAIRDDGRTVAGAIADAEAHFCGMLEATGSALLRERALDVKDVCIELLRVAYGRTAAGPEIRLTEPSICVADSLTPGQFLNLDRSLVEGLVLGHEGTTSHTVILARSLGIPTLVGATDLATPELHGSEAIVDADIGILVTGLNVGVRRYYELERRRIDAHRDRLARLAAQPAATADGRRFEIAANIIAADEVKPAVAEGAEAVGLFRTEMLFLDRATPPDETEQFEMYRQAAADAEGRRVIIRTLDVGGDKPVPWLRLARESNPYLGYRAVRIYPEYESLFRTQVRALVRASAFGRLQLMVPMIATAEEAKWVRRIVAEEQARCLADGIRFDASMPVGAMIEVPAAALEMEALGRELDFFSIGTNDLLQYFMAADRGNAAVAGLLDPFAPAFLRLLRMIVDDAHTADRWIGLCGEMGGDLRALPLLVGIGLDEISMAAPMIPAARAELAGLSAAECRTLVEKATACDAGTDVEALLVAADCARAAPLIDPELVIEAAAGDRAEAIKRLVDQLYVTGRTDRPRDVEEAVHAREAVYSTGFGFGFAIPHCKTAALRASSLAVLRTSTPVDWNSADGEPVRFVILLAIRESDAATDHMKTIAALARRLMHDEFRDRLAGETDPADLCRILSDAVRG